MTALTLNRLGRARNRGHDRPRHGQQATARQNIRQDIIERTDGIPLFVEEMTKAVLEAESEGAYRAGGRRYSIPSLAVPASLHASLMARLDRLGSAKEVAQIGAVIGREFSHALLAAVARKRETELAVRARSCSLMQVCCFGRACRHMRPICSSTPLYRTRLTARCCASRDARFTRRIAETLESQFAEIAESQPELLARHCTEAGLIEKAVGLWGEAGLRSLERSALVEAVRAAYSSTYSDRRHCLPPPHCVAKRLSSRSRSLLHSSM